MTGSVRLPGTYETNDPDGKAGGIAAYNKKQHKLFVLFYAYSDSVFQSGQRVISCDIAGLGKKSGEVTAIKTLVSDDSNFFDEYMADRTKTNITQQDYNWSSDSFVISTTELQNETHLKFFFFITPFYQSCSALKRESETFQVENGVLQIRTTIPIHGVMLYEIKF
jgi:hypothetical protein